jgi:hypothetical protein
LQWGPSKPSPHEAFGRTLPIQTITLVVIKRKKKYFLGFLSNGKQFLVFPPKIKQAKCKTTKKNSFYAA